jgi:hypothetical protein
VPVFEDILSAFQAGNIWTQSAIVLAWLGIAFFAILNIKSLAWNIRQHKAFRRSKDYEKFANSNAQSSELAGPLAAAMSVNVGFIVGLVFVPGLWSVVEYLFPMALLAFMGIGFWALRLIGQFLGRVLSQKDAFDVEANNSLAQLVPAFALSMVGVGLAAPAAMSTIPATIATAYVLSSVFAVMAIVYAVLALSTSVYAMIKNGVAPEAAPTLMIVVPITTVLGILFLRQAHGVHVLGGHGMGVDMMVFLARLVSLEAVFLALGLLVLIKQKYAQNFLKGETRSAGSYALVCPGVAFAVMMHFFINKGLVGAGILEKFGPAYWSLTGVALLSQVLMIALVLYLNRRHKAIFAQ